MKFKIQLIILFALVIFLSDCKTKTSDEIIKGEYKKISVFTNYGKIKILETTDAKIINNIVRKINSGSKKDVSGIVWERGPDGKLVLENEKQSLAFTFFSNQSSIDVFWSEKNKNENRLYQIDTNINFDEFKK